MRQRPWLGLGVAALFASGCAQTFDATTLGVPAALAAPAGEAPTGQAFRVSTHSVHGLFGLVTLGRPSMEKALAGQLVGGKAVANLKITTKSRWSDLLFTGLTLGLIAPKTVIYEGIIVGR